MTAAQRQRPADPGRDQAGPGVVQPVEPSGEGVRLPVPSRAAILFHRASMPRGIAPVIGKDGGHFPHPGPAAVRP
ncbi:hypothetical protein [Oceanibacterium hippocampi]|uniref:Uncharacterized protein n=1 Tax=Oceanibacterium hippocampi TaxID=745714 RepID=A0A1Y5U5R5_9PROT|nr:hypothetical protein [Oceanibacterium hippocampi]SLN77534.1 hypothetical protein OCH7691_04448 [Oceanibacterium hippocampi]